MPEVKKMLCCEVRLHIDCGHVSRLNPVDYLNLMAHVFACDACLDHMNEIIFIYSNDKMGVVDNDLVAKWEQRIYLSSVGERWVEACFSAQSSVTPETEPLAYEKLSEGCFSLVAIDDLGIHIRVVSAIRDWPVRYSSGMHDEEVIKAIGENFPMRQLQLAKDLVDSLADAYSSSIIFGPDPLCAGLPA